MGVLTTAMDKLVVNHLPVQKLGGESVFGLIDLVTTSFSSARILLILLTSILIATLPPSTANGQAHTFTNKNVDYVIEFPSASWRARTSTGYVPARTRKQFVYADGNNVRLLVRRKLVAVNVTPSDMIRRRKYWDKRLSGYILLKEESFTGQLSGARFSYEYVRGGKIMNARIYYLEADNRTIYSLLFTGPKDELQSLGDQTESIARSFRLKNIRRSRN